MTSRSSGFTLVEVLVATGLLVVIALGTAQMFALALRQNMTARDHVMMTIAAARKLDELAASANAGTLAVSPADALDRDYDGFFDIAGAGGAVYARRWLISFPADYAGAAAAIVVRTSRPDSPAAAVQIATVAEVGR